MKDEKKQEKISLEERAKIFLKLEKEGRLPLGIDDIRVCYPKKPKQQKKD